MKLLQEVNKTVKDRNFVAKHAHLAGRGGEHEIKTKHSRKKRKRDKQSLKKEVSDT